MGAQSHASVTPERILQLAWGYAPTLVLEAAVRHRVFDILDSGPMNIQQISAAAGASVRGLVAIMSALVGLKFLAKDGEGLYSLTPESAAFLVSTKPAFHGGLIRHTSDQILPKWLSLNEIVATGKPAGELNREGPGAEFFQQFVTDILPLSYPSAQALARHLNLQSATVLDLAAGSGVWGIALAQSSEQVRVTALDWATVIPVTRNTVAKFGLAERFSFIEGDLLQADFGQNFDLATLGHILHSEGEERSRALLAKTYHSLAPGGTIAIAEFLVNADRTGPLNGLLFAVNMLVNTDAGNTYSFEEIGAWLDEAGFANTRLLEAPGPSPLILATKPNQETS